MINSMIVMYPQVHCLVKSVLYLHTKLGKIYKMEIMSISPLSALVKSELKVVLNWRLKTKSDNLQSLL